MIQIVRWQAFLITIKVVKYIFNEEIREKISRTFRVQARDFFEGGGGCVFLFLCE